MVLSDKLDFASQGKMALQDGFVVLLMVMCMSFHGRVDGGASHADRSRLITNLLTSYNKLVHPESPVNVTFSMDLQRIERLDETTNSLYITALAKIVWYDDRLVWDPASFSGVSDLSLTPDTVWTPRIKPNTQILEEETVLISLLSNGEIGRHQLLRLAVPCTSDLINYPFDSPSCQFKVEDWGYSSLDINLTTLDQTSGAVLHSYELNAFWEITSFSAVREEVKYSCCFEAYEQIKYTIDLSRKPNGFAVRVLAPAVLTSLLILFCFLIPPSCGERAVVCSVLLVATIIQLVSFNLSVPMVGGGSPFLSVFFCFSVFLAFFAFLVSVFSLNLTRGFGVDTKDGEMRTASSSKTAMLKIARFIDVTSFIVFTVIFAIAGGVILNNHPK